MYITCILHFKLVVINVDSHSILNGLLVNYTSKLWIPLSCWMSSAGNHSSQAGLFTLTAQL